MLSGKGNVEFFWKCRQKEQTAGKVREMTGPNDPV
jgi:hypothetical protein